METACKISQVAKEIPEMTKAKSDLYTHDSPIPALESMEDLVRELHKVFEFDKVNVDYVQALLSAYRSNPADWKKYSKFDPFRYTRNLVDTGNGKFNLIALCWGEGHGSSIHDHSASDCFVKILDGELTETMYTWPSNYQPPDHGTESVEADICEMRAMESKMYKRDQVAYINDSMGLHRMANPSHSNKTVSLHLYCPPFESCQVFDQRTGRAHAAKVTFWSKFGERTPLSPNSSSAKIYETNSVAQCCGGGADLTSK